MQFIISKIYSYQLWQLCQTFSDFGDISQLNQVLRIKHVNHSISPDLADDGLNPIQGRVDAPVVVDGVQGDGVEHNVGHHLWQDGPVLDEPVVVRTGLLMHDAHDPL